MLAHKDNSLRLDLIGFSVMAPSATVVVPWLVSTPNLSHCEWAGYLFISVFFFFCPHHKSVRCASSAPFPAPLLPLSFFFFSSLLSCSVWRHSSLWVKITALTQCGHNSQGWLSRPLLNSISVSDVKSTCSSALVESQVTCVLISSGPSLYWGSRVADSLSSGFSFFFPQVKLCKHFLHAFSPVWHELC